VFFRGAARKAFEKVLQIQSNPLKN
jgi:hypothetical protein